MHRLLRKLVKPPPSVALHLQWISRIQTRLVATECGWVYRASYEHVGGNVADPFDMRHR